MVERGVKAEQQGGEGDQQLFLPPGFRFHPTDEEVITSYLLQKLLNPSFSPRAMGEVNLNKCEPWDLPSMAKMGEKEWYFFCHKDMKYPTGMRTNRATEKGYWKATGKDREIFKPSASAAGRELVGMKKTLVFYMGRAPRGSKTNWVMHEFRVEGKYGGRDDTSNSGLRLRRPKDEWVVCKVFHKQQNTNGEADHKKAAAAAAMEYSASVVGTPNVSSISVDATADADGVDGFIDSMLDPVAYFDNNSTTTNNPLPGDFSTTTSSMINAGAAADYYSSPAAGGGFVDLPPTSYTSFSDTTTSRHNNLNHLQQAAVVADSTAAPNPTSSSYDVSTSLFSWNLPHAAGGGQNPMGSSGGSFNLHDQLAMMTRALGGGVPPNLAAAGLLLPTPSSSPAGISQHNSAPPPVGRGGGSYASTNYYYYSGSGSGSAAAGGGGGTVTGQSATKNLGA